MLSLHRSPCACLHSSLCEMSRAVLPSASSHFYEFAEPVTNMHLSCLTLTSKWSAARVLKLVELFDRSRNKVYARRLKSNKLSPSDKI